MKYIMMAMLVMGFSLQGFSCDGKGGEEKPPERYVKGIDGIY